MTNWPSIKKPQPAPTPVYKWDPDAKAYLPCVPSAIISATLRAAQRAVQFTGLERDASFNHLVNRQCFGNRCDPLPRRDGRSWRRDGTKGL